MTKRRAGKHRSIASPYRIAKLTPTQPVRRSRPLEQIHQEAIQQSTDASHRPQSPSLASSCKGPSVENCATHSHRVLIGNQPTTSRKRRRSTAEQTYFELAAKNSRQAEDITKLAEDQASSTGSRCSPIAFWAKHTKWPSNFAEMEPELSIEGSKKRSLSTNYSQSVRDGRYPKAHTRAHEKAMEDHGMVMDIFQDEAVIDSDSSKLCDALIAASYTPPEALSKEDYFINLLRKAQRRNENRVVRDITSWLVPSAELIYIRDKTPGLEHVVEELGQLWDKCTPIFGPQSKPDIAAGLAASAFTANELNQLKMNHTPDCPTYATDEMFFPFLICEVKCGERVVSEAERQAMQSASLATKMIIKLFARVSRAHELNNKILVFSIAHDPSMSKIYGHYACTTDAEPRYFRRLIRSIDFTEPDGRNRWTTRNITLGVYDLVVPEHIERIRSALKDLSERQVESFLPDANADTDAEELGAQEIAASAPSSQEAGIFKKPSLPSTSMVQRENDKLQRQISKLLRQQQEQQRQQQEQMERLRTDNKEKQEWMERQMERQREDMERQREDMERQREQMERQMEQQNEMIALLRQSQRV